MRFPAIPAILLASFFLTACTGLPAPGIPSSSYLGPTAGDDAKKKAYQQGFGFGRRDAGRGKQANYMLYNNYYNSSTKKDFASGYMHGYRKHSR